MSEVKTNVSSSGGVSFAGLLTIVFITLKLIWNNQLVLVVGAFAVVD